MQRGAKSAKSKTLAKTFYWYEYWTKKKGKNGFEKDFFQTDK